MYIKKRVYNENFGLINESLFKNVYNELLIILGSVPGVVINKSLFKFDGTRLDITTDTFYTTHNIPLKMKYGVYKKYPEAINPQEMFAPNSCVLYIWFSVNGIDYAYCLGTRLNDGGVVNNHINETIIVCAQDVNDASVIDKRELNFQFGHSPTIYEYTKQYFADIICGYDAEMSNFYLIISFMFNSEQSSDSVIKENLPMQFGYYKTKNNKTVILPLNIIAFEPQSLRVDLVLKSAFEVYSPMFNKYKGDHYTNKTPMFEIDIFNRDRGYLDTFKNAYMVDIPETRIKNGELVSINGKSYMRIVPCYMGRNYIISAYTTNIWIGV